MQGPQTTQVSIFSGPLPLVGRAREGGAPDTQPRSRRVFSLSPRGFTLTELLIVIAIIGVLASLIAAAAVNALRSSKRSRIVLEIKNMAGAIENFKNEHGAYPPNAMNPNPANNPPAGSAAALAQRDVVGMFKKAFPRSLEAPALILGLCGQGSGNSNLPNGMTATEAVYFWLGGFSSDAQYPISGPGGPSYVTTSPGSHTEGDEIFENRQGGYEFNVGRLGPRVDGELDYDTVRFIEYPDPANNTLTRRINFWQFYPDGSEQPYVYFDCSRNKPYQYDMHDSVLGPNMPTIYPILKLRTGVTATNGLASNLVFAEKFQILHAGLDDAWGEGFQAMGEYPAIPDASADSMVIFPEGPFTGEVADTLSNITDGELADSQE
jgi:prepilin-type N-terminal cleavage/methylation domain-containing protein